MFRFRRKDQETRRNAVRKILVEQLENRKLMAGDVMSSVMGSSYFGSVSGSHDSYGIVDSFTVDLNNLPKGMVVGAAASSFGNVWGEVGESYEVDMSSLMRSSPFGEAVQGQFGGSTEIVDSFTVDLNNLPKGMVVGATDSSFGNVWGEVGESYEVDMGSLLRSSPLVKRFMYASVDLPNWLIATPSIGRTCLKGH